MTDRTFIKWIEHNDWEGETWVYFLQLNGNEDELTKLGQALSEEESDHGYEIQWEPVPEADVDACVRHALNGYERSHNKITGVFTCPEPIDWVDSFYKGPYDQFQSEE